ncbi:hypothetical protein SUGI_0232140 [Cryptomeria japonica]|uniref:probable disease resistance protein At1g61300 n=1 Tax=Cryptomeria japonica TaxID=3369 RepID=UPI002408E193|nr:probable disease resistance protein At1g61300 [Cryptomeria japonica]GLJ14367.1 hypothetical protein SUGI_0232140 [Cryptomeria japonica]
MACTSSSHKPSFSEFERKTFTVSYDAFINHRGPDTKATVAFAIYESLEERGFWTFLDDQELQPGDSIEPAIQNAIYSSSVQIAIFSPGYAESPWCLNELVDMLKTKALFIPVFCDVKPSDLRFPHKGAYAHAIAEHEGKGRFSKKMLQQWKGALRSSSLVSGYELSKFNDNVEELRTKITLAVQERVGKKGFPRYVEVAKHHIDLNADAEASTSRSAEVYKKSSLLRRDSHPVGIHSKVEDMLRFLQDPQVPVIAVVGMGGSGKTFLLQNVYSAFKSRFDNSIWLSISKSYAVKNLQHDIAFRIGLKSKVVDGAISQETAAELIHDRLQGKKTLIVLDDLWNLSVEDNLLYKLGLPTDKNCKVVVTTRNKEVARNSNARIYEMENLSDEDSWKLFCVHAFPGHEEYRAPTHLEEVGREIVKQCGNLPLAIKTTAASLAKASQLRKWESKRRQLERAVIPIGEHDPVMDILKLSYDSLPLHLKPCFAYLSFFPEDAEIDPEYLVYIWIGEGFVPAGEEQWDTALDWLDQLDQLCLLQLWEDRHRHHLQEYGRLKKYCKIHDLLHDLAIQISRENKCVFSLEEASTHTTGASGWCRILLAKKDRNANALSYCRPAYLRTLSMSENWNIKTIPENLFTAMRGLRVLDSSGTKILTLPASVGKMVLLKVLNLRDTKVYKVPECVRYLKSLLFLAMPFDLKYIPVWISELKSLHHLECECVHAMPKGISDMASLRTLRSAALKLSIEKDELMRLEDLAKMTQIQELRLCLKDEMELERMEEGILAQLIKMRRLRIRNMMMRATGYASTQLSEKMRTMRDLESLQLERFLVPGWICDLANLRELELTDCKCIYYPELQRMPNLVRLALYGNEWCKELPKAFGKSGGFPRLRFLIISSLPKLREFPKLEEGSMACLEEVRLLFCRNLKKVGEGLERLKRLKVFDYSGSGTDEVREALKEGGEYRYKIEAINSGVSIYTGI